MRYLTAVLEEKEVEWTGISLRMVRIKLITGPSKLERSLWDWYARKEKIRTLGEVSELDGTFNIRKIVTGRQAALNLLGVAQVVTWLASVCITHVKLTQISGWEWINGKPVGAKWSLPNMEWSLMLWPLESLSVTLNRNWQVDSTLEDWSKRWRLLWKGAALTSHKVWMWRILQQGLRTLKLASKWGVSDGICPWCHLDTESMDHLMWDCNRIRSRIAWLSEVIMGTAASFHTLLQSFSGAFGYSEKGGSDVGHPEGGWGV
ncbi:hypothetical protein R1sor_012554 [Riccia sorocarpa]|uniref:Reverse transcriptase zinc-binding domain-containing protein n=1 Tax=Riccia sorocarpa TaxID=122646 RepID=A0ABD3I436_9MARC